MWTSCLLFLVVFELYLRTHCASFNINDSGETILSCTRLTISHSPGYPLHMLWGKFNNVLFPFGQPMLRVTLASIWTASLSVVVFYRILKRVIVEALTVRIPVWETGSNLMSEAPAWAGAMMFASSYQQWFQACGAKGGIYSLNIFLMLSTVWGLLQVVHRGVAARSLFLISFLFGLGLANHWPNIVVMIPVCLWLFFVLQTKMTTRELRRVAFSPAAVMLFSTFFLLSALVFLTSADPRAVQGDPFFGIVMLLGKAFLIGLGPVVFLLLSEIYGWAWVARFLTVGMVGVTPYVALSIRSTQHPVVSWWNPDNAVRLWETVIRKGYETIGDPRSIATLTRNVSRFWFAEHDQFGDLFSFVVFVLAIVGLVWLWRRQPALTAGFMGLGGVVLVSTLIFNNPAEGYQWTMDNFFTPCHLTVVFFAAMGLTSLLGYLHSGWPSRLAVGVLVVQTIILGFCPMFLNWSRADQSRYVSAYDYGINMLKSVNRTGVLLCNGDIDILPLWYLQQVEGKRPEVASLTMQLVSMDWYRGPLFEQYPFLKVPVTDDIRPQTIIRDMIDQHAPERSFYYSSISVAPWLLQRYGSLPDGCLFRVTSSKGLGTPFSVDRINRLWSGYRLRCMDAPDRGYWDEYTDVMKDSYGIGLTLMGPYCVGNGMPNQAVWSLRNALRFRQVQVQGEIHNYLSRAYLILRNAPSALEEAQAVLRLEPGNPYGFALMGEALLNMGNLDAARQSFDTALRIAPQFPEAEQGMGLVERLSHQGGLGVSTQ